MSRTQRRNQNTRNAPPCPLPERRLPLCIIRTSRCTEPLEDVLEKAIETLPRFKTAAGRWEHVLRCKRLSGRCLKLASTAKHTRSSPHLLAAAREYGEEAEKHFHHFNKWAKANPDAAHRITGGLHLEPLTKAVDEWSGNLSRRNGKWIDHNQTFGDKLRAGTRRVRDAASQIGSSVPGFAAASRAGGMRHLSSQVLATRDAAPGGEKAYAHTLQVQSATTHGNNLRKHLIRQGYDVTVGAKNTTGKLGSFGARNHWNLTATKAGETHHFTLHERPHLSVPGSDLTRSLGRGISRLKRTPSAGTVSDTTTASGTNRQLHGPHNMPAARRSMPTPPSQPTQATPSTSALQKKPVAAGANHFDTSVTHDAATRADIAHRAGVKVHPRSKLLEHINSGGSSEAFYAHLAASHGTVAVNRALRGAGYTHIRHEGKNKRLTHTPKAAAPAASGTPLTKSVRTPMRRLPLCLIRHSASLVKAAHDVTSEPRDADGKWTQAPRIDRVKAGDPHPTMPNLAPTTQQQRDRVRTLGGERPVPPTSWGVEIDESPGAKNTATFYDAKGRRQYIRSQAAADAANVTKFSKLVPLREALPKLRNNVESILNNTEASDTDKACAAIVRLMDTTTMRVGSEVYAQENQTYGASSLRTSHATLDKDGKTATFEFPGKDSVPWKRTVIDGTLYKTLSHFMEAEKARGDGKPFPISETQVSSYLAQFNMTAKQFRTYHATAKATSTLLALPATRDAKQRQADVVAVVKATSELLGNTPAVCRANYIDPEVLRKYLDGTLKESKK